MPFQVHTRQIGPLVVIEGVGRLTLTDGHTRLRDQLHVSTGSGAKRFILNLDRVEFIDSYGIGELVRCYSVVRQAGGEMKIAGVQKKILEILEISHLTTVFEIFPEEQAAVRAFGQRA